jgi:hypothetical protein
MTNSTGLFDPSQAWTRVEFGMARAEVAGMQASRAVAEQWAACADVLAEARAFPEVFTDLPAVGPESVEFAVRAAVADLAVRLGVSAGVVREQSHLAELLMVRTPLVWAHFREGEITAGHARVVADLLTGLPEGCWAGFQEQVLARRRLPVAKFRAQLRLVVAKLNPVDLVAAHQAAALSRSVWIEPDRDGMALFIQRLPEQTAHRAYRHVDHLARTQARVTGEERTLPQLRADIAGELLAGSLTARTGVGVTVAVTVPVLSLLGHSEQPASLDGIIPIDPQTARELATHAPSFQRILTDPITSTILDVDRTSYRPPADLARLVRTLSPTCDFPGCTTPAARCDLDHITDWHHGGTTAVTNLQPLCRDHHRLKHNTRWRITREPEPDAPPGHPDRTTWTSPTGHTRTSDPPPF